MCRWAAYLGRPVFLEQIVSAPAHSLIVQSRRATECKTQTNADGVGVAWYGARPEPGLYRDVHPAWSDPNLRALCQQIRSGCFLAHVRASTGAATSRNNCHPFALDRWSFMHNGQVGGFDQFRKKADMLVPEALYDHRRGATDSEILFLLAIAEGLHAAPERAMVRAVRRLEGLSRDFGAAPHMRVSAAWSDGVRLWALRYASDDRAPSVYYRWCPRRAGWAVVSEPLETTGGDWTALAPGHLARFEGERVEILSFADLAAEERVALG